MVSSGSESDDGEFLLARYGTPMEELDDPEVPKKPIAVHEQVVTDAQGRRRFHGAFTGGFSAGYYNTVDTEEGWTPSGFKSSRSERTKNKRYLPEDFMDEEDISEYGIAPQKIVPQTKFASENKENDKALQSQGRFAKNATMLLGLNMIQTLVVPVSNNIGTRLLQKMGWKPGQGIGPKIKKLKKSNDFIPENVEFAPEDFVPMEFSAKDNIFGLGYTGMDPKKALHDKVKKSTEIAIRTKSGAKLSFVGQAFGVGAYEEDDQDIYAQDSMANYDLEMTDEKNDGTYGWSKPTKAITGTETRLAIASTPKILQNFHKAEKSTRRKIYRSPILPPDYDPLKRSKVMEKYGSFGATQASELTPEEEREKKFERLNPNDRGQILGEKTKNNQSEIKIGENDSIFTLLKPSDRQRLQILKHGGVGQPLPVVKPKKTGFYEPFASNPQKQHRYETYLKFLRMKESEPYSKIERDPNMTEWEAQQEREEFMKSSRFFQPLSATMSSRFAPESESKKKEDEKEETQKEAVKMKMFGMLTRDTFEWHPDSLLCKRFNVPNPYPHSDITGVPGQDSGKMEMFLHPDDVKQKLKISDPKIETKNIEIGSKTTGIVKDTKNPPLLNRNLNKNSSRWDAKPREQLALPKPQNSIEKNESCLETGTSSVGISKLGKADLNTDSTDERTVPPSVTKIDGPESDKSESEDSEKDEKPERPPMDIFRAIFANSDSDSSDSDSDEIMTRSSKMKKKEDSPNKESNLETDVSEISSNFRKPTEKTVDVNKPKFHQFSFPKKKVDTTDAVTPNSSDTEAIVTEQSLKKSSNSVTDNDTISTIPLPENAASLSRKFITPTETVGPTIYAESSNLISEKLVNAPSFHKFLSKSERVAAKRPSSETLSAALSSDSFGPPLPPEDAFGPALPPIKVPKTIDFHENKPKKLKNKKKKHKKEKRRKNN